MDRMKTKRTLATMDGGKAEMHNGTLNGWSDGLTQTCRSGGW